VKKVAPILGAFALGLVLMVGFEHVITRILGLLCLFAFIVMGVFAIADPDALSQVEDPEQRTGAHEG